MKVYIVIGAIILSPVLVMLAWQWVVLDVFSGMVTQGLLPATISYWQAVKFVVLLAVLGVTGKGGSK